VKGQLPLPAPHAATARDVLAALDATPEGLAEAEVEQRRRRFGPNRLRELRSRSALAILVDQFRSMLVLLLAGAAALSLLFGRAHDAAAVVVVLLVNGAIGFVSELRAVQSMAALRKLGSVAATVRRGGRVQRVDASGLVPGDVVVLEGGDVVTADLRLLEGSKLQADESLLTGESVPVDKDVEPVDAGADLAGRRCMLFKGTAVTRGAGAGVVVGTGMETELGRIARLVETAEDETTPLEKRLDRLGQRLVGVTLAIAAAIVALGLAAGRDTLLVVQTAIALAVATVPEGLPIITTLALAGGMRRMARRHALVNRLSAVETLGATGIIFSDKTGTLTENRMTVAELALADGTVRVAGGAFERGGAALAAADTATLRIALEIGALCNDASLDAGGVGDPLEVALLAAARAAGIERAALLARWPELREIAFDPAAKRMATVHGGDGALRVALKGAPEAVLDVCTRLVTAAGEVPLDAAGRDALLRRNDELASHGMRVLALATGSVAAPDADVFADLAFAGLVGLEDPPRRDVRDAIGACRRAGIRVVMVTGDQHATARSIAKSVGLVDDDAAPVVLGAELDAGAVSDARLFAASIFARISPEQKLQLIARHQAAGAVVAMTGDGVNDAPALRKADIGVAMGLRGTEVARQASDIVLRDDSFATIVAAIEQGRVIFSNIRRFVVYLLSCNASEIGVVGIASALQAPLPILPLQILFLNLVTDVFPALALGVGPGDPAVMRRSPRDPRERVLEARHWRAIAVHGASIGAAVLGAFAMALGRLGADERGAVTIAFLTLAFAQLWHVFDMRDAHSGVLRNAITRNPWVWAALALCSALLLAAVFVPPLAAVLGLVPPSADGWALIAAASAAPTVLAQTAAVLRRGRHRVAALPLLALAALAAGCRAPEGDLRLVGTVERTLVEVTALISEQLVEIAVERGEHVEAGAPLARLDPLLAEAELAAARAAVAGAQTQSEVAYQEHRRVAGLHGRAVASEEQLDRARLARDEARAALDAAMARMAAAQKRRNDTAILAPVAGVVDQLPFDAGERVPAGAVVAVLLADGKPWVRVWAPERAIARLAIGTPAEIRVDGFEAAMRGRVLDVAREASFTPHYALTERERVHLVYQTRVEIDDAPAALRPGAPAEVRLALGADEPAP